MSAKCKEKIAKSADLPAPLSANNFNKILLMQEL